MATLFICLSAKVKREYLIMEIRAVQFCQKKKTVDANLFVPSALCCLRHTGP